MSLIFNTVWPESVRTSILIYSRLLYMKHWSPPIGSSEVRASWNGKLWNEAKLQLFQHLILFVWTVSRNFTYAFFRERFCPFGMHLYWLKGNEPKSFSEVQCLIHIEWQQRWNVRLRVRCVSLEELETHSPATPLISMRAVSLASSQRCLCVDADALCKRALSGKNHQEVIPPPVKYGNSLFPVQLSCKERQSSRTVWSLVCGPSFKAWVYPLQFLLHVSLWTVPSDSVHFTEVRNGHHEHI